MKIFLIDDEELILGDLRAVTAKAAPEADIYTFSRAKAALDMIQTDNIYPDIVFSDIEMPGLSGLAFACELKKLSPGTRIVFVTGYKEYAIEAFRVRANGYLLKPVREEDVREEISFVAKVKEPPKERLEVKCFGHFDVRWNGKPVIFNRKQSKELLAYLIDREGAMCSSGEIAMTLWEDLRDVKAEQNRLRVLINDLKSTLKGIGAGDILIREKRQLAVRRELIYCDYYRMLEGDMDALNSYYGEYMVDYSWAELTNARLQGKTK